MNELVGHPDRAAAMGTAGRERAVGEFGWKRDRGADVSHLYESVRGSVS